MTQQREYQPRRHSSTLTLTTWTAPPCLPASEASSACLKGRSHRGFTSEVFKCPALLAFTLHVLDMPGIGSVFPVRAWVLLGDWCISSLWKGLMIFFYLSVRLFLSTCIFILMSHPLQIPDLTLLPISQIWCRLILQGIFLSYSQQLNSLVILLVLSPQQLESFFGFIVCDGYKWCTAAH